jgi:hypothetical protein
MLLVLLPASFVPRVAQYEEGFLYRLESAKNFVKLAQFYRFLIPSIRSRPALERSEGTCLVSFVA